MAKKGYSNSSGEKAFTVSELDWFSKSSYNLGLTKSTTWEARNVIHILTSCLSLLSGYPPDISKQTMADIAMRSMFCDFIAVTILLALARTSDSVEEQLQDYLTLRQHIRHFDTTLDSQVQNFDEVSREDLSSKLSSLLVFEFEAAICLKSWDDLHATIRAAKKGKNLVTYQAMADCLLRCQDIPSKGVSPFKIPA
jgi:hypothetical protein